MAIKIKADSAALTRWVEYQNGISFQLKYVARSVVQSITESNTELRFDPKQKARLPRVDPKGLSAAFVEAGVIGWRGVTPNSLAQLIPLDLESYPVETRDTEIPFTVSDCVEVVQAAYELESFLQENCTNIAVFRSKQEDEVKN